MNSHIAQYYARLSILAFYQHNFLAQLTFYKRAMIEDDPLWADEVLK